MTVAGRSARRVDGQGGAGARRRALPARVWRTAAQCGLSVWRHHQRESVVGRPEGAQPPNTAGGNITKGGTSTRGNPTRQHQRLGRAPCWAILLLLRPLSLPPLLLLLRLPPACHRHHIPRLSAGRHSTQTTVGSPSLCDRPRGGGGRGAARKLLGLEPAARLGL